MFCSKCGSVVREGDKFCVNCGAPLVTPEPVVESIPTVVNAAEAAGENIAAAAEIKAQEAIDETVPDIIPAAEAVEACKEAVRPVEEAIPQQVKAPEAPVIKPAEPVRPVEPIVVPPVEPVRPVEPIVVPPVEPKRPVKAVEPEEDLEDTEPYEYTRLDKPLSVWGYIWRILLFAIPVLNIIPLFVMAFSSGINKNSKNFASGVLVLMLIGLIIGIGVLVYFLITTDPAVLLDNIKKAISSLVGT